MLIAKALLRGGNAGRPAADGLRYGLTLSVVMLVVGFSLSPNMAFKLSATSTHGATEHVVAYALLTLALFQLYPARRWLAATAAAFLLGVGLEGLQAFLPARHLDPSDVLWNGLGIVLAWATAGLQLGLAAARTTRSTAGCPSRR